MTISPGPTTPGVRVPRQPDRRRRRRFRVTERRSGFDRRRSTHRAAVALAFEATLLRLRDDPRLLAELLVAVNLLSVLDMLITFTVLRLGAVDLNPIMAGLIDLGPAPAAAAKVGAVAFATFGLWTLRRHRAALATAFLVFCAYGTLVTYELVGILHLVA